MRGFREHDIALRIWKLCNLMLMTAPFGAVWYLYYMKNAKIFFFQKGNWFIIAAFFIIYALFTRTYNGMLISYSRISEIIYSQSLAAISTNVIMYIFITAISTRLRNPLWLLFSFAIEVAVSILWSYTAHHWYFNKFEPRPTVIIYEKTEGLEKLVCEYNLQKKFEVVNKFTIDECLEDLSVLDECEVALISDVPSHKRNAVLVYCINNGKTVFAIPRIGDSIMESATGIHMFHLPVKKMSRYRPGPEYMLIKKIFDLVVSFIGLATLWPFMVICAVMIKAYDGGPVLYKQKRLTKDGKVFEILKFRSMKVDAESDGVARLSTGKKDSRITPVGKLIRAVRFDELPQIINILRGDMSIVGPRPERPEIAAEYAKTLPEFNLRLQAKAGLTGYAQVYGKYNTTPKDKLLMDLEYIAHPSFVEDLKICFATLKILFISDSTEGVAEGSDTAQKDE